ncbi:MAG: helix-turn-helix domain-containing protein [Gammaproteobacteria bacterium]
MDADVVLLWVDFSSSVNYFQLPDTKGLCQIHRITNSGDIAKSISSLNPDMICFEFGYAETDNLLVLSQTKIDFPSIPIIMLTEQHSEELAIWALRSRVWDYFIKPLTIDDLLKPLNELSILRERQARAPRIAIIKETQVPAANIISQSRTTKTIFKAQAYVESHLAEKLSEKALAKLCDMSSFHFSRTFKQVCGVTFRDFIIKARIKKAAELLTNSDLSITEVSYEVGFQDLSNFSRTFRRITGKSPSDYRNKLISNDEYIFTGIAVNQ